LHIQSSSLPLKITTGQYEVIASGLVHIINEEVKFELAGLVVRYIFRSDSQGLRMDAESNNKELIIYLYNFSTSIAQGKVDPIEIGTIQGRRLFASFLVCTVEKGKRELHYTFMLMEGENG
jgi:hypothetical protein